MKERGGASKIVGRAAAWPAATGSDVVRSTAHGFGEQNHADRIISRSTPRHDSVTHNSVTRGDALTEQAIKDDEAPSASIKNIFAAPTLNQSEDETRRI